ncbi:hypothetical protein ACHAPJ_004476 [Fusarium lateritium]
MAKVAGIDRSLILTMDMALHLPDLGFTAAMSLIKSITSIPIFTNDDNARELATKASRFLRQNNWRLSASLNITAKRTLASEAEAFIPPLVVADKPTHLGRPWKPLNVEEIQGIACRFPQTTTTDQEKQLKWENFQAISYGSSPE